MGNYLGVNCPVCQKNFNADDDIVVCPVCGAPHHRQCYAQRDECAFTENHITGKEWRPPQPEAPLESQAAQPANGAKTCNRCGSQNQEQALFCQICGQSLTVDSAPTGGGRGLPNSPTGEWRGGQSAYYPAYGPEQTCDPYEGAAGAEPLSNLSAKDIAMYVGPNYRYFLERFYQIEKLGRTIQPNLAAFFLGFFYYFYRKMYMVGIGMLGIFLLCLVPFFLSVWELLPVRDLLPAFLGDPSIASASPEMQRAAIYSRIFTGAIFFNFIFSVTVSMFANRIYHKQAITKIREVMQDCGGAREYQTFLPRIGGVDRISVVLLGVLLFVGSNVVVSVMIFNFNLL